MGSNSGFPLGNVMQSVLPSGSIGEIFVPQTVAPAPIHFRIGHKLGAAFRITRPLETTSSPSHSGSPWATDRHQHVAKQALALLERQHDLFCLLPAAEDEFCSSLALAPCEIKRRLFVCFHQPPAWFRLNWRDPSDFDSLGGIICLGQDQADYFRSVCITPIHVIKHGVFHQFFKPPAEACNKQGNRLLFVGQWLRDFETLAASMNLVWQSRPDVHLDCVVPRFARHSDAVHRLAIDPRVTWHADLTDHNLLSLYQQADLLFIPVIDAVANNAVLESLACGLPIISTDVGGMKEYVASGAGYLCRPQDAFDHADAVLRWLASTELRRQAGLRARQAALESHDWSSIGQQLVGILIPQWKSLNAQ